MLNQVKNEHLRNENNLYGIFIKFIPCFLFRKYKPYSMHKYDTDKNNYNACNYHSWTHYRFAHIFSFPTFQMFQMHHGNKPITSQSSFDSLKLNLTFVKNFIFKNLFSSNCFLLMQMHVKYR